MTPYLARCPDHCASRCRWHADDDPASGERQQHPHQTGHQRVCEPDSDVQRDPHQTDGEAVLRGLSQGRLPASRTPPFRWQDFVERSKGASSSCCCGAWAAPPTGTPPWHFKLWTSPLEPSALEALAQLGCQVCAHPSGLVHPVLLSRDSVLQGPRGHLP